MTVSRLVCLLWPIEVTMTEQEIHGSNAVNISEKSPSPFWSRYSLLLDSTGRDGATDAVREWPFSRFPPTVSWSAPTFIVEEKPDYTSHPRLSHVYMGLNFKYVFKEIKDIG